MLLLDYLVLNLKVQNRADELIDANFVIFDKRFFKLDLWSILKYNLTLDVVICVKKKQKTKNRNFSWDVFGQLNHFINDK